MEAWIAILLAGLPPLVLAARAPRTEKWRRARKRFWLTLPFAIVLAVVSFAFINPLGPAIIWLGAWFILMVLTAVLAVALKTISDERRGWNEKHQGRETVVGIPGTDPSKPWKV